MIQVDTFQKDDYPTYSCAIIPTTFLFPYIKTIHTFLAYFLLAYLVNDNTTYRKCNLRILFRYDLEHSVKYGTQLANGTWIGMIGEVQRQVSLFILRGNWKSNNNLTIIIIRILLSLLL